MTIGAKKKYDDIFEVDVNVFSALHSLKKSIEEALKNSKDIATKGHLELCLLEIDSLQI